jgi:hypothetical protein
MMARRLDVVTIDDVLCVARIARQMGQASRWAVAESLRNIADVLELDPDEHDAAQLTQLKRTSVMDVREHARVQRRRR